MNITIKEIVEFSKQHKLTHVPSALSMSTYIDTLFTNRLIVPFKDRFVLGKPFGSQAYYIIWKNNGYMDGVDISKLSIGVKHDEISFVDYGEETMGNALGVAIGIAIANPKQTVWVNITDATLQMGSTLEAIQYAGHNKLNNIILTIDNNNCQVTGNTSDVLSVKPAINFISDNMWDTIQCNGHDQHAIKDLFTVSRPNFPRAYIFDTIKGYGVSYMEEDPIEWHYKIIEDV
ncbi:hypothetical protein CL622_03640 [archaeon]|nr:hypothetical protein [archaeon]